MLKTTFESSARFHGTCVPEGAKLYSYMRRDQTVSSVNVEMWVSKRTLEIQASHLARLPLWNRPSAPPANLRHSQMTLFDHSLGAVLHVHLRCPPLDRGLLRKIRAYDVESCLNRLVLQVHHSAHGLVRRQCGPWTRAAQ